MFKRLSPAANQARNKKYISNKPSLTPIRSAAELLGQNPKCAKALKRLPKLVNAPDRHYEFLYRQVLENFAEFTQSLPNIKIPEFNTYQGMLTLGVERMLVALSLYRKDQPVDDIPPEKMTAEQALWTYALFTAALFRGIGIIPASYLISISDSHGKQSNYWYPYLYKMQQQGTHYRFSYDTVTREIEKDLTVIYAIKLMPAEGFDWIESNKDVLTFWTSMLRDDVRGAGTMAKIVLPAEHQVINQAQTPQGILSGGLAVSSYTGEGYAEAHTATTAISAEQISESQQEGLSAKAAERNAGADLGSPLNASDVTHVLSTERLGYQFAEWLRTNQGPVEGVSRVGNAVVIAAETFQQFAKDNGIQNWRDVQKSFEAAGLGVKSSRNFSSSQLAAQRFSLPGTKNTSNAQSLSHNTYVGDVTKVFTNGALPKFSNTAPQVAPNVSPGSYPSISITTPGPNVAPRK